MKTDTLFSRRRVCRHPDRHLTVDAARSTTGRRPINPKSIAGRSGNHFWHHFFQHTFSANRKLFRLAKEGVSSMFSGVIRCNQCGNEAVAEILGIVTTGPAIGSQRYFGYNQVTGYLSFRCPACNTELAINPAEVVISRFLQGLPVLSGILLPQARKTA